MPEFEHKNLRKLNTFYCVHKILARNFSSRKFMENTFYNSHVTHCANDLELEDQDLNALRQVIEFSESEFPWSH